MHDALCQCSCRCTASAYCQPAATPRRRVCDAGGEPGALHGSTPARRGHVLVRAGGVRGAAGACSAHLRLHACRPKVLPAPPQGERPWPCLGRGKPRVPGWPRLQRKQHQSLQPPCHGVVVLDTGRAPTLGVHTVFAFSSPRRSSPTSTCPTPQTCPRTRLEVWRQPPDHLFQCLPACSFAPQMLPSQHAAGRVLTSHHHHV